MPTVTEFIEKLERLIAERMSALVGEFSLSEKKARPAQPAKPARNPVKAEASDADAQTEEEYAGAYGNGHGNGVHRLAEALIPFGDAASEF